MDMNDRPKPDLSAAFAGVIAMTLRTIRARGWRSLRNLPAIWRESMLMYGYGLAFTALVADWRAGKLLSRAPEAVPAPVPEPVACTEAPEREAACAQPSARHRPSGWHYPASFYRKAPDECPALPAAAAEADRPCADRVRFASARPRARGRTAAWLRPPRHALDPFAVVRLPTDIFATGRSP
jgi:hypothetical protein